jgi:hypothetical protein
MFPRTTFPSKPRRLSQNEQFALQNFAVALRWLVLALAPFAPFIESVETPGLPSPVVLALTRDDFRRAADPGRSRPVRTALSGSAVPVDSLAGRASGAGSGRGGDPWGRTTGFRPFFDLEEIFRITGGTRSIRCGAGVTADRCVRSPGGM